MPAHSRPLRAVKRDTAAVVLSWRQTAAVAALVAASGFQAYQWGGGAPPDTILAAPHN
jgi:hypothetical protein